MLMFIITIALIAIFYFFYIKPQRYWKSRNVPYKNSTPFLGDMAKSFLLMENLIVTIDNMYRKFPDSSYFGFLSFHQPILVIKDPELIKQVTVKDFDVFPIHRVMVDENVDPMFSKNLFSIRNVSKWRQMRATLSPTFTTNKMKQMFILMKECAQNFTKHFIEKNQDVQEVDIKDAFRRYANDIIASTAFGISCNSLANPKDEFYLMGKDLSNFGGLRALKFFLLMCAPWISKVFRLKIFANKVSNFFRKIIKDNIRMREEQGIVRPDMIQLMLEARKGKLKKEIIEESELKDSSLNFNITDEDITAQAILFFLGGFDTTSTMMSFALSELAANPDIQERLFQEITEVNENCEGKPNTYSSTRIGWHVNLNKWRRRWKENALVLMSKCPLRIGGRKRFTCQAILVELYLMIHFSNSKYIPETLRKWSLAAFIDRQATSTYTIETEKGESVKINKGDVIWIPGYSIQRDPLHYPDPDLFDPERFDDERKHQIKPYTYLPFGSGPRNCIGFRFALLEAKTVIFYIMLNFEIHPTKKTKLPLKLDAKHFMPQIEGGFHLRLKKR